MSRASTVVSRRQALAFAAALPAWSVFASSALAAEKPARPRTLVIVFLRGAADGLNLVVPHGDDHYYRARRRIAIAPPDRSGGALDLDGRFGLHPRLSPLLPAYREGELALVTAVGSPNPTRSHFEAQDHWQVGSGGGALPQRSWIAGWLGNEMPSGQDGPLRAVAFSERVPLAFRGVPDALAARRLEDLRLSDGTGLTASLGRGFSALYRRSADAAGRAGSHALAVQERLRELTSAPYRAARGTDYGRAGAPLSDIARLIKAEVGLRVAWADFSGWDTHRDQGRGEHGRFADSATELGRALGAFRSDLGPALRDVVVVVATEFGRTVAENGSGGTDHGHGSVMMVLGGRVRGGRVYGTLPPLSREHLYEGRDVPVTTDFRDVLAELVGKPSGSWFDDPRRAAGAELGLLG